MARIFTKNLSNYLSLSNGGVGRLLHGFRYVSMHARVLYTSLDATGFTDNRVINLVMDGTVTTGLAMGVNTGTFRVGARSQAADTFLTADGGAISTGVWTSVGGTFDFTGKTMAGFVNGIQTITASALAFGANVYTHGAPTVADSISGDGAPPTTTTRQVDGPIAEVAIWGSSTAPLSQADFADLSDGMSATAVRAESLIFYMPLLGTTSPEPATVGAPPLRFNGTDGRVNCGTGVMTSFTQTTPFTIELRMKTSSTVDQAIVCSQMTGTNGKGIQFGLSNSDGKPILRIQGVNRLQRKSDVVYATGAWVHGAVTYDGSTAGSGIQFFLNGAAVASTVANENVPGDMTTTNPTYLGVRNDTELPYNGDLRGVRIWKGMQAHPAQLHALQNAVSVPIYTLFDTHGSKFAANASQGVATDGTHIYAAADATVVKHTMAGANVGSFSHGIAGFKNEDGCVVGGTLYQPLTNHSTTPRLGKMQLIRTSDMALLSTIDLSQAIWPASVAYHDGFFWLSITENLNIYKYNASFVLQDTYTFPLFGANNVTWPGYSGIEWIGEYLYGNKHESDVRGLDVAHWTGTGFEPVGAFRHVTTGSTQGLAYDAVNAKMYWAARGHSNAVYQSDLTGGLIGAWRMDESTGTVLSDDGFTGSNDGALLGGVSWVPLEAPQGTITGSLPQAIHPPMSLGPLFATARLEMHLNGVWADVTADVSGADGEPIEGGWGIRGNGPTDRLADLGVLRFTLKNDASSSGGAGYYSPAHPNARPGFTHGAKCRLFYIYGGIDRPRFYGKIHSIDPAPGTFGPRRTRVIVHDLMDDLIEADLRNVTLQINQNEAQLITTLLAALPAAAQPVSAVLDTGLDVSPYAFDTLGAGRKAVGPLSDIAVSALGYIHIGPDGILRYENRHARQLKSSSLALDDDMLALEVPSSLDGVFNHIRATRHPKVIDAAATTVLWSQTGTPPAIGPAEVIDIWGDYYKADEPSILIGGTDQVAPVATTDYLANTLADGTGTNKTANITVTATTFASSVKFTITNNDAATVYLTKLQIRGRGLYDQSPVTVESSSVQPYGDRVLTIDLPYQTDHNITQDLADYLLAQYETLGTQAQRVTFSANRSHTHMAAALTMQVGDRITISETQTGLTLVDTFVNSVLLRAMPGQGSALIDCEFGLAASTFFSGGGGTWLLDDAVFSVLDSTTIPGFA
jgi:hypothetical protein